MKENNGKNGNGSVSKIKKPWTNNDNPVWLASTISLKRNIEKFKFPAKLETERKKQIVALIGKDHLLLENLQNPVLSKAEDLTSTEKEYLMEHFLNVESFQQASTGDAFIIDDTGELMTAFNLDDHLLFRKIDSKGDLETSWNQLIKMEMALGKTFNYAYSPKYGFLTSDPTECGTGLLVAVYLQLPGLIHTEVIDDILEKETDESLSVTGLQGNPTEIIGDVLMIQNNYTLGLTEENILSMLRTVTSKLMLEETAARNNIKAHDSPNIKDKVSRAYGILMHSYQIEAVEALNAISLLKLGLDMEWLHGTTRKDLNQLFFNCRRAHLLTQYKEKINQEDIIHKRSEYIHKTLKDVKLDI